MDKPKIKEKALTENTAQGVFKHLNDLESNREHMRNRWIWELLQNARDASTGGPSSLIVSVECKNGELVFLHNGRKFTEDDVAHLIYHGSTKLEIEGTIGQFGSGFLTTHLLSKKIQISGSLTDDQFFDFWLERETSSIASLHTSMDEAWKNFNPSSSPLEVGIPSQFTTRFRYPISEEASDELSEGISNLKKCAPFVVVFNKEFSAINIESSTNAASFKVEERKALGEDRLQLVTVTETNGGTQQKREYLLAQRDTVSVAIPLDKSKDEPTCLPLDDVPRLFLGFPLVGTETFSFPAVINSFRFTPTENRDGVYLGQSDNRANQENQSSIEVACELLMELLQFAASSGYRNIYRLANVPAIPESTQINSKWLKNCLEAELISKIRTHHCVLNELNVAVSPQDLNLPVANELDSVKDLWDLLKDWDVGPDVLPKRREAAGWWESAISWAKISEENILCFKEVVDGQKLAEWVDSQSLDPSVNPPTYPLSRLLLKKGVNAISWLDRLIDFLRASGLDEVIRKYNIVPNQRGFMKSFQKLRRDEGIDEKLKNIAELLDWSLREELRDTELNCLSGEKDAHGWDDEYVVSELIKKLRDRVEGTPDDVFERASVDAFAWITENGKWNLLRDFPVFSDESSSPRVIKLVRAVDDEERPLAPVSAWPEDLQPFFEIFPRRYTLADAFFKAAPNSKIWERLEEERFIRRNVVITKDVHFNRFLPDEPLAEGDHKTSEPVSVTDVAFITKDEIGIMSRVRKSSHLARIFWRFLADWLVRRQPDALEAQEALCDCQESHRYYPARWLVPLLRNHWVPCGERRPEIATAQSLSNLLRGSEWNVDSLEGNPAAVKLLRTMGIPHFEFLKEFVSQDDDARNAVDSTFIDMLATTQGDVNRLSQAHQYLKDLETDPSLPQVVAEHLKRKRRDQENKLLGDQIEKLVRQSLEEEGFVVQRTGTGSDFQIEHDNVTQLELAKLDITWLVEVKATRSEAVRITYTQASTAVERGRRYLVCVVPVEAEIGDLDTDGLQADMRFVQNIGPRVAPLCSGLERFSELRKDITRYASGGVQLEVESGTAMVRISKSIWRNEGISLVDLANRLN